MTTATPANSHFPELRSFVKDTEQKLYDFCFYMSGGSKQIDDIVLSVYRELGDYYRRISAKESETIGTAELRVALFRFAVRALKRIVEPAGPLWYPGRDPRMMKALDGNLFQSTMDRASAEWKQAVTERFGLVDSDFRMALILKDVLGFEDEEVVQILGVRWGVYRHRLHRGRLDFRECLIGVRSQPDVLPFGQSVPVRT